MYVGVCNNVYISRQCDTSRCDPRFEKFLEEVTRYTPRYMSEMESIFNQSQKEGRKRISNGRPRGLEYHDEDDQIEMESTESTQDPA
ncbi:unnamed protein product [Coregonus sp. 'balchen']|nr:unnamed protein product [Coregonus sp. 'balchen']